MEHAIILNANEAEGAKSYKQIATMSGVSETTVISTIKAYVSHGIDAALTP